MDGESNHVVIENINDDIEGELIDEGREDQGHFIKSRQVLSAYVNHILTRLVIVFLILLDIIFVIISACLTEISPEAVRVLDIFSLVFVTIFLIELCFRIFIELNRFPKKWLNILDGFIVVVSFIIGILLFVLNNWLRDYKFGRIVIVGRVIRLVLLGRSIRLLLVTKGFQQSMRLTVGGNKRRYQKDGFDLDLCYITKHMIAMSFPSSGLDGMYRNKIEHVSRFLDEKHAEKYKVYNLCSEKSYDCKHFHNRVERFYIDDHNVPTLVEAIRFAENVRAWLTQDPENVVAVHCKGGKGRTGTMICIYLLDYSYCPDAATALQKFGNRRTNWEKGTTFQGIETPSQSRFVEYFDKIRKEHGGQLPPKRTLRLKRVIIRSINGLGNSDGSDFSMNIYFVSTKDAAASCTFATNLNCQYYHDKKHNKVIVDNIICEPLHDEIKFMFHSSNKDVPKHYDDCAFFFTLHMSFIDTVTNSIVLRRDELDNPHKKKFWNVYQDDFAVELQFERLVETQV